MMRQQLAIHSLCLAIAAVAWGVAAWTVVTGQIAEQGIDALFLLAVCLLAGLAFSRIPLEWLRRRRGKRG